MTTDLFQPRALPSRNDQPRAQAEAAASTHGSSARLPPRRPRARARLGVARPAAPQSRAPPSRPASSGVESGGRRAPRPRPGGSHAIEHERVKVRVQVQRATEALNDDHGAASATVHAVVPGPLTHDAKRRPGRGRPRAPRVRPCVARRNSGTPRGPCRKTRPAGPGHSRRSGTARSRRRAPGSPPRGLCVVGGSQPHRRNCRSACSTNRGTHSPSRTLSASARRVSRSRTTWYSTSASGHRGAYIVEGGPSTTMAAHAACQSRDRAPGRVLRRRHNRVGRPCGRAARAGSQVLQQPPRFTVVHQPPTRTVTLSHCDMRSRARFSSRVA